VSSPGYWMYETSGVLRPAVEAYLNGEAMTDDEIAAMRAYLRQWIAGPWKAQPGAEQRILDNLRLMVDGLVSRETIRIWLDQAEAISIDPL
jgi:hypothetical protein